MLPFRASAVPAWAAAFLAAAVLSGCASTRLSSEPPPGVRLAGDWRLDAARSDDLGKAVDALRAQRAKARREEEEGGDGSDGRQRGGGGSRGRDGDDAGQSESAPEPQSVGPALGAEPSPGASPVDELMSSVPRGDYVRITVSSSAFTVASGDASNEYTPGLESEISAEQGDAQQTSGWKGADYVIDTKPQWGAEIIQTYGLTPDGRLAVTVRLTGRGIKLTFSRIYDRTTRVAPLAPPTIN
jgi:hypothetical protein